jgi:hypothetical protein
MLLLLLVVVGEVVVEEEEEDRSSTDEKDMCLEADFLIFRLTPRDICLSIAFNAASDIRVRVLRIFYWFLLTLKQY